MGTVTNPRPMPSRYGYGQDDARARPPSDRFATDGSITWEEFYALLKDDIIANRAELARGRVTKDRRTLLEQRIATATKTIEKYGGEVP